MTPYDWSSGLTVVTGGASFIGSHLVEALLARGARVQVIENFSSGRSENLPVHPRLLRMHGDLLDSPFARRAIDGARVVFHLAADHGGRGYIDRHQAACATNLILDGLVFKACKDAKVEQVVYASSGCVYPASLQTDPAQGIYLTEDLVQPPYEADNLYGWAKLMGELTLRAYHADHGLKSACCRYFTAYGPRAQEDHAIMAMIARARIQQDPFEIWGDGTQVRNWTYVSDIVEGTIRAAERIHDGSAVNLGTMQRTTVREAAEAVCYYAGYRPEFKYLLDMPTGPKNRVASNHHAQALLNWAPQVDFSLGVKKTLAWYFSTHAAEDVRATLARRLLERTR